jgi:hypothetical protein
MPKVTDDLPHRLLVQIGRVAAISAIVEQNIILWASALYAHDTGGDPIERLRMDFQRLREKWYAQASKRYDKTTFNKVIHPINSQLAKLWRLRGPIIYGVWKRAGNRQYHLSYFEQRDKLKTYSVTYTIGAVTNLANQIEKVLKQIWRHHARASPRKRRALPH